MKCSNCGKTCESITDGKCLLCVYDVTCVTVPLKDSPYKIIKVGGIKANVEDLSAHLERTTQWERWQHGASDSGYWVMLRK